MATLAYLRISTSKQDLDTQRLALLDYAHKNGLAIDQFVEVTLSTRKKKQANDLELHIENLQAGDVLMVSELSRIGRTIASIIRIIDQLIKKPVKFIAIKEGIVIDGEQDLQSKLLVTIFGLLAELERDLISQRTKEGLHRLKRQGKTLGRPKGTRGKSKLDGKEQEIAAYLDKKISKASIAKLLDVTRPTLDHFIKTRKLEAGGLLGSMQK